MFLLESSFIPQILSAVFCNKTYKHGTFIVSFVSHHQNEYNQLSEISGLIKSQARLSCERKPSLCLSTSDGRKRKRNYHPCSNAFPKTYSWTGEKVIHYITILDHWFMLSKHTHSAKTSYSTTIHHQLNHTWGSCIYARVAAGTVTSLLLVGWGGSRTGRKTDIQIFNSSQKFC